MIFFLSLIIVLILALGVARPMYKELAGPKIAERARVTITRNFNVDEIFVSPIDTAVLGISFAERTILLGNQNFQKPYSWSRVTCVEVLKNGTTVTETNRGSQIGSALVGGALFGPMGVLLGGLSGSSRSTDKIKDISLKIIVDDNSNPVYVVPFFRTSHPQGYEPKSILIRKPLDLFERFHAHLLNSLKEMKRHEASSATLLQAAASNQLVGIEGLEKLWLLKQEGVLTEEEFSSQKATILRNTAIGG